MEKIIRELLVKIGEDPDREGLLKTPARVKKTYEFLTKGYQEDPKAILSGAIFHEQCNHMIIVDDIEFYSMCEHHMLPFSANATSAISRKIRYTVSARSYAWSSVFPAGSRSRSA